MTTENYERALAATKHHHANSKTFSGRYLQRYMADILPLVKQYGCETLLDLGCGKGKQWKESFGLTGLPLAAVLGVRPTLYDPGVPEYAAEPVGKFDIVICTQVCGSVPVDALPWFIDRLYGYATKVVYVGERLGPVRKGVHKDMAEEGLMPHGWTHDQWAEALRRPDGGPAGWLRTNDRRTKQSLLVRVA